MAPRKGAFWPPRQLLAALAVVLLQVLIAATAAAGQGRPWAPASGGGVSATAAIGRRSLQAGWHLLQAGQGQQKRCPKVSRELLAARARNNLVMFAVLNSMQMDLGRNWLHHVKKAGMDYYLLAAADPQTSAALAAAGEPCFEWFDEEAAKLGLAWGEEGWRRVTWARVFVLDTIIDYGFDLVVSDVDVVWFKDPAPLLKQHPAADLLVGLDHGSSENAPGDGGLEVSFHPNASDFNTGAYLLRYGKNTSDWAHAFAKFFDQCDKHDQVCCYWLIRTEGVEPLPPPNNLIFRVWHARITMAAIPVSMFESGHTLFLQQLHKEKQVVPYNVHATWTYGGLEGKKARLRDLGLWVVDPPEYYTQGSFVTVDLQLPEVPAAYNQWQENEDMIALHLSTLSRQLQQAYVGWALAVASKRAFILPKFVCYCEKTWYGTVRCRIFDAQGYSLPVTCPTDYVFQPDQFASGSEAELGTKLDVREPPFLEHPNTPQEVKDSVLTIQPSAALDCTDCVKEQKGPDGQLVLLVPPSLPDAKLLPLLGPYQHFRIWRLSFEGVGSLARAFGGFAEQAAADAFDRRMASILTTWCCRRGEEAPRYHKETLLEERLSMTPEFSYSRSRTDSGRSISSILGLQA